MAPQLTVQQRRLARRLDGLGWGLREIAAEIDCSAGSVMRLLRGEVVREGRPDTWVPGPGRLTLAEREEISLGLHRNETFTVIADLLNWSVSTVSREVSANGGRHGYRAWR